MSNTSANIKNSWSLISFAEMHDRMQLGSFEHVDKETGDISRFKSLIFSDGDAKTFVSFSRKVGELTPQQLKEQKDDLQVVAWETEDKSGFTLCKRSDKAWEDVNLF